MSATPRSVSAAVPMRPGPSLRAGVARGAAREDAVALAGERVGLVLVGEREFAAGEEHEAVTGRIDAADLREAVVQERPPRRHGRHRDVEHDAVRLILVEAAVEEIAQVAPALRAAS